MGIGQLYETGSTRFGFKGFKGSGVQGFKGFKRFTGS